MKLILILLLFIRSSTCLFDPVSIGVASAVGALFYNYKQVKEQTYCRIAECCIPEYIPANIDHLEQTLKNNLFGQHIVINELIPALRSHFKSGDQSKKSLVISFHGTPGTGKNYVADFIAKSLYKKGVDSQYVHKFMARSDFPVEALTSHYKVMVLDKMRKAVADCPWSLFIFDEVHIMPTGILDAITSLLDHHSNIDGVSYRNAVVIFLSNTAGVEIADHLGKLMESGTWGEEIVYQLGNLIKGVTRREKTTISDFEQILELGAYNLDGGLKNASIIESHLIDLFIPFLPLEKSHVEKCIRAEYQRFGHANPSESRIKNIMDKAVTFEENTGLFAKTGCKRISKKVEVDLKG